MTGIAGTCSRWSSADLSKFYQKVGAAVSEVDQWQQGAMFCAKAPCWAFLNSTLVGCQEYFVSSGAESRSASDHQQKKDTNN